MKRIEAKKRQTTPHCARCLSRSTQFHRLLLTAIVIFLLCIGRYVFGPQYHDSSADCLSVGVEKIQFSKIARSFEARSYVETFSEIPPKFSPALLEYTHGEHLSRNASNGIVRETIALCDAYSLVFDPSAAIPVAFVINLDHRTDRIDSLLAEWEGRVRFIRLSAKPHTGGSNGVTISHVALVLTLERLGWPYTLVFEDDAMRAEGWDDLAPRILDTARAIDGNFSLISLGPVRLFKTQGFQVISPQLLWAAPAGAFCTTVVIWGRRAIRPAHAFLPELASASAVHMAAIDSAFLRVCSDFGYVPWVPARRLAVQRPGISDNAEKPVGTDFTHDFDAVRADLWALNKSLVVAAQSGVSLPVLCHRRFWIN